MPACYHPALPLWALMVALLVSGCTGGPSPRPLTTPAEAGVEGDALWYRGEIGALPPLRRLFELYESQQPTPTRLRIDSPGGDIHLALTLGEWILEHGLDVEIEHECGSACANYVFTAGRRKWLQADSRVYWHGGAFQESLETDALQRGPEVHRELMAWRERELAFFARAGVDPRITIYGQRPPWDALYAQAAYLGYDYSLVDLARFGLRDIKLLDAETWRPPEHPAILRITVDADTLATMPLRAMPGSIDAKKPSAATADEGPTRDGGPDH